MHLARVCPLHHADRKFASPAGGEPPPRAREMLDQALATGSDPTVSHATHADTGTDAMTAGGRTTVGHARDHNHRQSLFP